MEGEDVWKMVVVETQAMKLVEDINIIIIIIIVQPGKN